LFGIYALHWIEPADFPAYASAAVFTATAPLGWPLKSVAGRPWKMCGSAVLMQIKFCSGGKACSVQIAFAIPCAAFVGEILALLWSKPKRRTRLKATLPVD
jgi:hypothetical protein